MKKRILCLFLFICLIAPAPLFAFSTKGSFQGQQDTCLKISDLAVSIMRLRQAGEPISRLVKRMNEVEGVTPEVRAVIMDIIEDAYSEPRYVTKEYIEREVTEFGNKWYLLCIRSTDR